MLNSRHRGVVWVVLMTWISSPYAMAAQSGTPNPAAPKQYITIPNSTPAARSSQPIPARQYTTIPATLGSVVKSIPSNSTQSAVTPPVIPTSLSTYDQLREAAVKAELSAQKSQLLANQAKVAMEAKSVTFMSAVNKQAGLTQLFGETSNAAEINQKGGGNFEVSNQKMATPKAIVTDKSLDPSETIDVQPCNKILGISILSTWAGQSYKTSDGQTFSSYSAAKDHAFKADFLKNPIQVGKTGNVSQSSMGDTYNSCMNIEVMSAELDFSKKFADKIAQDAATTWEPILNDYYSAWQKYQVASQDWLSAEASLSDLCAKMILEAEAKDPKLEGLANDAYGFWLATKLRYYYMDGYSKALLPSESSLFDNLQIQKIFQGFSNGKADTAGYRTSLQDMYNSAVGPAALLRLDRAFGFAAAYATSLKTENTLTKRVAQAVADKAAAGKMAASTVNIRGDQRTTEVEMPLPPPPAIQDLAMAALSDRVTDVFYALAIPVLDHTKFNGPTPSWFFISNSAHDMDTYFFALKDQAKSFVVMNKGFDIYDPASGWHKMQIDWKAPVKRTPHTFFEDKSLGYTQLAPYVSFPADGSCPNSSNMSVFEKCTAYMAGNRFMDSYLSDHPLYDVLSQSAKEQTFWLTQKQTQFSEASALNTMPKFLLGITNAFGISAHTLLSAHGGFFGFATNKDGTISLDLRGWKESVYNFASYVEKGLQADKAAGYPIGTFSKHMNNFSSVAFLFHPISVGFGTCSIYETLFSPFSPTLGYSCGDYAFPLLMLYQPDKSSKKTSSLFRDLRRMSQWVADQIIPNAHADDIGIQQSSGGGGGGGVIESIAGVVAGFFGSSSGGNSGAVGVDGGGKSASEIAAETDANIAAEAQKQAQALAEEVKKTETGVKAVESGKQAIDKHLNCENLNDCMANGKAANNRLKELSGNQYSDGKKMGNTNAKVISQGNSLINAASSKNSAAGELEDGALKKAQSKTVEVAGDNCPDCTPASSMDDYQAAKNEEYRLAKLTQKMESNKIATQNKIDSTNQAKQLADLAKETGFKIKGNEQAAMDKAKAIADATLAKAGYVSFINAVTKDGFTTIKDGAGNVLYEPTPCPGCKDETVSRGGNTHLDGGTITIILDLESALGKKGVEYPLHEWGHAYLSALGVKGSKQEAIVLPWGKRP